MNKEARRQSRTIAIEALFAYLAREGSVKLKDCFDHVLEDVAEKKVDDFAWELAQKGVDNFAKNKVVIRTLAPEFPFEKIAPINRVLLVLGITEMKHFDTPPIVVINEYIELAKIFGEERSASFINGVLDQFRKNIGKEREEEQA